MIREGVQESRDAEYAWQHLLEGAYLGMESVGAALDLMQLQQLLDDDEVDQEELDKVITDLRERAEDFFKDYNLETDKKVTEAMLGLLLEDLDEQYQPAFIREIDEKYRGKVDRYLRKYFRKSFVVDREAYMEFLDDPDLKTLEKDPAFEAASSLMKSIQSLRGSMMASDTRIKKGGKKFIAGLIEMKPEKDFYPDANSTMRLTYGTVGDYEPRDAVLYYHYTTLEGVMEKEDPTEYEFTVTDKLKELYETRDYGPYGEDGIMKVCFTTNNDITGGNSGSPVINGRGELIGIAFDGNWEAMSGDVAFEPELQKCINVDIRYVLFVIDKYAGATHLVDEMTLVE